MTHIEKFIATILQESQADNYGDAIMEWAFMGESRENDNYGDTACACGHPIKDVRIVRNKTNQHTLEVGNCCIKKFGISREHWNGSKMAYLQLGMAMTISPGSRDYLKFETLPRIKKDEPFTLLDLHVLEKVTGKVSRFKASNQVKKSRRWDGK